MIQISMSIKFLTFKFKKFLFGLKERYKNKFIVILKQNLDPPILSESFPLSTLVLAVLNIFLYKYQCSLSPTAFRKEPRWCAFSECSFQYFKWANFSKESLFALDTV